MTGLIDTNILVYMANTSSPFYQRARQFLQDRFREQELSYIGLPSVYEFLRVTTHPRVFERPLSARDAWNFLEALFTSPYISLLQETEDHLNALQEILPSVPQLHGNLFHDCHIATLMREHGVKTIFTKDSDFRLFRFLRVVDPLD